MVGIFFRVKVYMKGGTRKRTTSRYQRGKRSKKSKANRRRHGRKRNITRRKKGGVFLSNLTRASPIKANYLPKYRSPGNISARRTNNPLLNMLSNQYTPTGLALSNKRVAENTYTPSEISVDSNLHTNSNMPNSMKMKNENEDFPNTVKRSLWQ